MPQYQIEFLKNQSILLIQKLLYVILKLIYQLMILILNSLSFYDYLIYITSFIPNINEVNGKIQDNAVFILTLIIKGPKILHYDFSKIFYRTTFKIRLAGN
ncbi:hypothetical protein U3516DRAFT_766401 [Neocallimastix sp. 'constans']